MNYELLLGDCIETMRSLPSGIVQTCVTSPPYFGLRSYLHNEHDDKHLEIGTEETPADYVGKLVEVFREVRRLLRDDGTLWLNLGDSYNGSGGAGGDYGVGGLKEGQPKYPGRNVNGLGPKQLLGIPWRVAFALQADGWILRSDIIWHKKAPMPESVTDRVTKAHEYVFLLSKQASYFYDAEAIAEPAEAKWEESHYKYYRGKGTAVAITNPDRPDLGTGGERFVGGEGRFGATRNKRSVWTLGPESFSGWTQTSRSQPVERHDVSDDTNCKVSPDCPVHAGLFDWAATDSYDVRVGDLLSRMSRKRSRRAPKLAFGSAPTDQRRGVVKSGQNSDLPHPPYSLFAIDHSNGNHKTAPDPVTNQPYNAYDETASHTDGKPTEPDFGTPVQRTSLSNSALGESASIEASQLASRNVRNEMLSVSSVSLIPPECICEFYHEITEETSHFATMPTKLVEPCILAGSSSYGCCAKCGAPWARVVERQLMNTDGWGKATKDHTGNISGSNASIRNGNGRLGDSVATTLGWAATCTCNADVVPCVVLDPFAGAGTTLLVANRYGRRAIGCELNPEYIKLATERLDRNQPMLAGLTL